MSFDNRSSARDGNGGGNSDMESQPPSLCKAGCGFYGNPTFEGLCSVCYKDTVKCQMQAVPTATLPVSPHAAPSLIDAVNEETLAFESLSCVTNSKSVNDGTETSNTTPSVETGSPTISGAASPEKQATGSSAQVPGVECGALSSEAVAETVAAAAADAEVKDSETASKEKPKKNRCLTCKKRVGLTGFQCRCNGLFCTTHRYSDMHDCPFNYKELGQEQIRKNNPVVVGQKITKI